VLCLLSGWGDDNITIPLTTGVVFTIVFHLTHGGVPVQSH
jgi:hypothetical protein